MSCCQASSAQVVPVVSKHDAHTLHQLQSSTQILTVVRVLLETSTETAETVGKAGIPVHDSIPETWHQREIPSSVLDYLIKRESYRNSPNRLAKVIEESESFSKREQVQIQSTTLDFLQRAGYRNAPTGVSCKSPDIGHKSKANPKRESSEVPKATVKKASKHRSLISIILWPLKKLRDGYVSCMISIGGGGDLSSMVQGGHVVSHSLYFQESPLSKTDAMNYG